MLFIVKFLKFLLFKRFAKRGNIIFKCNEIEIDY